MLPKMYICCKKLVYDAESYWYSSERKKKINNTQCTRIIMTFFHCNESYEIHKDAFINLLKLLKMNRSDV